MSSDFSIEKLKTPIGEASAFFFFFSSRRRHTRSVSGIPAEPLFRSQRKHQHQHAPKSAADKGKDTRDYLAAAFPELNAWERAGADASSAGMVDAGFENQKELTKMQIGRASCRERV